MEAVDLFVSSLVGASEIAGATTEAEVVALLARAVGQLPGVARVAFRSGDGDTAVDDASAGPQDAPPERRESFRLDAGTVRGELVCHLTGPFLHTDALHAAGLLVELARQRIEVLGAREESARRIAFVAHELRAPLGPILLAAQHLQRRGLAGVEAGAIARQVTQLASLLEDLLAEARAPRSFVLRRTDLGSLVESVLEVTTSIVERRGHRLDVEVEPGLEVQVDGQRILQVLTNLVINAAKYTPASGSIRIAGARREGRVALDVIDDGAGIAAGSLERIFQPFVQLSDTEGGAGLGLSIARTLAELHGGWLDARSDGPGRGSCFTLSLPDADSFETGPKILVVGEGLRPLSRALAGRGCIALAAPSAPKAKLVVPCAMLAGAVVERSLDASAVKLHAPLLFLDPPGDVDLVETSLLRSR